MGGRDLPGAQGLSRLGQRATEQRPSGPDRAGRGGGAQVEPVAQPAGGRGGLDGLVGPGRPAAVDGGQALQPVALQAVPQPPQLEHLLDQGGVRQAVQVSGGQAVHGRRQRRQVVGRLGGGFG
jgi:hypothetical protein